MNEEEMQAAITLAAGLGAAPVRSSARFSSPTPPPAPGSRVPGATSILSPPVVSARPTSPFTTALPAIPTAGSALRSMLIQQASPSSQSKFQPDYQWAVLKVDVIIGGHVFLAGTKIVVSLSQTSKSGGGKAHTQSLVVKVWAKFGQTFDSSSWIQGNISPDLFTLTGQSASWSSSTGFGALDEETETAVELTGLGAGAQTQQQPIGHGIPMVQRCVTTHDPAPKGNLNVHSGRSVNTPIIGSFPKNGVVSMDYRPTPVPMRGSGDGTPLRFAQGQGFKLIGQQWVPSFISGYVDAQYLEPCPPASTTARSVRGGVPVTTPLAPVSDVRGTFMVRQQAPGPVLKAPPLSIHAPKTGGHVPIPQDGATWARVKQGAMLATAPGGNVYAGVTVQANEQVAAAANAVNVGGYSNYYRQIWVKRGQTFDSSSWKTGWAHESNLNISNVPAQWGQQGFGAVEDQMDEAELTGLGAGAQTQQQPMAPFRGAIDQNAPLPPQTGYCSAPNATVVQGYTIAGAEVRDGIQPMYNANVHVYQGMRVYVEPFSPGYTGWVWLDWGVSKAPSCLVHGLAPQEIVKLDPGVGASSAPVLPRPPSVPHPQPPVMTRTRDLIDIVKAAQQRETAARGAPILPLEVPTCLPGQVMYVKLKKVGNCPPGYTKDPDPHIDRCIPDSFPLDWDWLTVLKNNPHLRAATERLYCDWPPGSTGGYSAPVPPHGGFQHMQALRGLPEDQVDEEMEMAIGLGAGGGMQQQAQQLGPKSLRFTGLITAAAWNDVHGEVQLGGVTYTFQGGFSGAVPQGWPSSGLIGVDGYVTFDDVNSGGNAGNVGGRVRVRVGQHTNLGTVPIYGVVWRKVVSRLQSTTPLLPPSVPSLPRTPMMAASRTAGSRMMSLAGRPPPRSYGPPYYRGTAGLPEGFGAPGENVMDEMEFATGLGSAMAMSSFATHRALSPTAHSAPCPTGYHPEQRLVAPGVVQTVCVPNPTALAPSSAPIYPRGYNPVAAAQPSFANPFQVPMPPIPKCPPGQVVYVKYKNNAVQVLTASLLATFKNNPAARATIAYFYCDYGGYQSGPLHVTLHGLSPELEFAAGLGAIMASPGFGVIGPFGNASSLDPDEYQITGDGVYMWNGPQSNAGSISDVNGKSIFLNTGDRVVASGDVTLDVGNGKYYAKIQSDKAPTEPVIWVAVEYLAPLGWQKPAAPPPPAQPPKQPNQPNQPNAMLPAGKTDYTVPILVGAGVVGAGLIGYALYRSKKGKKGLRHAH